MNSFLPKDRLLLYTFLPVFLFFLIIKVNAIQSKEVQTAFYGPASGQSGNLLLGEKGTTKPKIRENRPPPWHKLPYSISMAVLAFLVLWRSWARELVRLLFVGLVLLALGELAPLRPEDIVSSTFSPLDMFLVFLSAVGVGLCLFFLLRFPFELSPEKYLSTYVAIFIPVIDFSVRLMACGYVGGFWQGTTDLILIGDSLVAIAVIVVIVRNYMLSPPLGKKRGRWMVYGVVLGNSPWLFLIVLQWFSPAFYQAGPWLTIAYLCAALMPLGFLISVLADDLMKVDGPSKLAFLFVSVVLGIAVFIQFGVPWFASQLEVHLQISFRVGSFLLTSSSVVGLIWLGAKMYSPVSQFFLPEHKVPSEGMEELHANLTSLHPPEKTLLLLADILQRALQSERCLVYWFEQGTFQLLLDSNPEHERQEHVLRAQLEPLRSAQKRVLLGPLKREAVSKEKNANEPALFHAHEATLFLSVRGEVCGAIWLGNKQSRTPYSQAEAHSFSSMLKLAEQTIESYHQNQVILEQERLFSGLREAYQVALEEQKEREHQISSISHDLKQPIESIRLLSEILEERPLDQQSQSIVQNLHHSALSLRSMLQGGLDLAKQRALGRAPSFQTFSLFVLEERLNALFGPQAARKGLGFELRFGGHLVFTDPSLLERILCNLVSNAIRYTKKGRVGVFAEELPSAFRFCVEDTGCGMSVDEFERASQAWLQLDSGAEEGHGLGLSIATQLVALLGGKLECHANTISGEGCLFSFSLPKTNL